jgi:hypothetical protein
MLKFYFMRRVNFKLCFAMLLFMASTVVLMPGCSQKHGEVETEESEEDEMYDNPDLAAKFQWERTKNPFTGDIPVGAYMKALNQTIQSKTAALNNPNFLASLTWQERGPNSDATGPSNGNTRANNGQTSGRIDAIMVDSSDATHKTVFIGGRDGGLWKTTDITAFPATWTLVNDFLLNQSIIAICQDPTDYNTMYMCTGESFNEGGAVRGNGVFKSTDHGVTWAQLASTVTYLYCTRILCDYQGNIYLGTKGNGLLRSTKASGGAVWTDITPAGLNNRIADLKISTTGGPARLHVATGIFTPSAYRYTDIPATVTSASGWVAATTPYTSFNQRCQLGISGNTLYAVPCNATYEVTSIYKSTDGGDNWAVTAGQPTGGWASGQGWYALTCAINPTDPNQCIVGGLDNFKTTNGGASWTKISAWVGTAGQYVHADQHASLWYDGGTKLLFGCDGGIHFSSDGGTTIRDRNEGLRLKQFYSVAVHPTTTNYFIAGAQDNGTHQLTNAGLGGSIEVFGGDGAIVGIDKDEPQFQVGAYVYSNFRRSANSGATWSNGGSNNNGQFINPFDYDNTANKVYAGYTANNYLRWENPQTGFTYTPVALTDLGGSVSAVTVSPYTPNRIYLGTTAGRVLKVDNANATPTDVIITPAGASGYVSSIIEGTSDQNLVVTYSNYGVSNVWSTTNGGTSWTAIDGNLPDMPVNWALYNPDDNTKLILATETGVWETDAISGGTTVWTVDPTFPTVRTTMLKYRTSDRLVAASTYGRGIWTAILPPISGCTPASIVTQPTVATTCAGTNTSFSVVAGGSDPLGYQWQVSINGGGSWNDITNGGVYSNATTATLNITGATAAMNGYQYRVIVTGNCVPLTVTSSAVTLTVNDVPTITGQPANSTICAGTNTSFAATATGAGINYQWQESTDGGANFNNVTNGGVYSGTTSNTLNLTGVPVTMNGNKYRLIVNGTCSPAATSVVVTLTVNAVPAITTNPSNLTICAGNNATFNVAATGGSLNYQWQESTNGGGTWNNLANGGVYSGVGTATLLISSAPISMNNNQYRVIVTGGCAPAATSTPAILTVAAALVISSQPANATLCAGGNTSFAVSITGTVISYQWQESTNGGGTWNNVTNGGIYSGATTNTLTLTGVTAGMNGNQYRCVVTGSCPPINSNAATLTVNTAPNITTQPASGGPICSTQNKSFSVAATGTALTYQWQESTNGGGTFTNITNGGVYSGALTTTLTITGAPVTMNAYQYRVVVSGTCAPAATSSAVTLTVYTPVSITAQPADMTICSTGNGSFSVTAAGTSPTYQWQVSTDGGGSYNNITNGGVYSNAGTATLNISGVTTGMNNYRYRVVVSGAAPCGSLTSAAAILSVSAQPTVSLTASPYTKLLPGYTTTLTVTTSIPNNVGYVWYRNNVVIPGANTATRQVTVNELGTYKVTVTDLINGCTNTSANVVISDSVSTKLFIFTNPNSGKFIVSYYTAGASGKQKVTIYDSKGALVYNNVFDVTQTYQLLNIDIRRNKSGVYYIVLRDANDNKLATGEVLVH